MIKKVLALSIVFLSFNSFSQEVKNEEFKEELETKLEHNVPEIDVNTALMMEDFVYLDTRSVEEYNISHIEGAAFFDFISFSIDQLSNYPKSQVFVVYCSVGSRSEKVTKLLIEAGYNQSFNLYGGLFEWSNQGLPMVDNSNEKTVKIHGVSEQWSRWISNGTVVY